MRKFIFFCTVLLGLIAFNALSPGMPKYYHSDTGWSGPGGRTSRDGQHVSTSPIENGYVIQCNPAAWCCWQIDGNDLIVYELFANPGEGNTFDPVVKNP